MALGSQNVPSFFNNITLMQIFSFLYMYFYMHFSLLLFNPKLAL